MGVVTTAMADAKKEKKSGAAQLLQDLVIGGSVGAIAKTAMAPVERIKLLLQTMDSNPDIVSGKVERYKGVGDCFTRVRAEQGMAAFWRGNLVNCLRYAPQQGSALAFNDALNNAFPKYDSKTQFWQSFATKLFSGGLAGGVANTICYPFDYARTRLASDVKKPKGQFNGIADCIMTTVRQQGVVGLYSGSVDCFTKVLKNEGLAGMYKGLVPELFRGVGGSLVVVGYDRIKLIFGL